MIFGPKMLLGSCALVATNVSIGTKLVVSGEFQPCGLLVVLLNRVLRH